MSGHHPFSNLTKDFTPEDWRRIEAITAKLRADIEQRKVLKAQATQECTDGELRDEGLIE